jgi:hypothetical protein
MLSPHSKTAAPSVSRRSISDAGVLMMSGGRRRRRSVSTRTAHPRKAFSSIRVVEHPDVGNGRSGGVAIVSGLWWCGVVSALSTVGRVTAAVGSHVADRGTRVSVGGVVVADVASGYLVHRPVERDVASGAVHGSVVRDVASGGTATDETGS